MLSIGRQRKQFRISESDRFRAEYDGLSGKNYRAHQPSLDALFAKVKSLLEIKAGKFDEVDEGAYALTTVRLDRGLEDSVPGLLWTYEIQGNDVTLIGVEPWDVIL